MERFGIKQLLVLIIILLIVVLAGYGLYSMRDRDDGFGLTPSGIFGNIGEFPAELLPETTNVTIDDSYTVPTGGTESGTHVVVLISEMPFPTAVTSYTKKYLDEGWQMIAFGDPAEADGTTSTYVRKENRDVNVLFERTPTNKTRVTISTVVFEVSDVDVDVEVEVTEEPAA